MGLKTDLAITLDPSLLMVKAGFSPDEWQKKVLRMSDTNHLLNITRQGGKTSVIAAKALHKATCSPGSLILILSPSERQSKLLLAAVQDLKFKIGALGGAIQEDKDSTLHIDFANKSSIIALPGKEGNVRGYSSVALVIIDEASIVPDTLFLSVTPMLSVSRGNICVMSTPRGKRGFFHKEWTEGKGWEKTTITADECPRITAEFLNEQREKMPLNWFRQEYYCEFSDTDDATFRYEDVKAAMSSEVKPLFGDFNPDDGIVRPVFQ